MRKTNAVTIFLLILIINSVVMPSNALASGDSFEKSLVVAAGESLKATFSVLDEVLAGVYVKNIQDEESEQFMFSPNPEGMYEDPTRYLYAGFECTVTLIETRFDEEGNYVLPEGITIDEKNSTVFLTNNEKGIVLKVNPESNIDELVGLLISCVLQYEDTDSMSPAIHRIAQEGQFENVSDNAGKYLASYLLKYGIPLQDGGLRHLNWNQQYDGTISAVSHLLAMNNKLRNMETFTDLSFPDGITVMDYDENLSFLVFTSDSTSLVFIFQTTDSLHLLGLATLIQYSAGLSIENMNIFHSYAVDSVGYATRLDSDELLKTVAYMFAMSSEDALTEGHVSLSDLLNNE